MTETRTHAEDVASIPTASRESAGIGPKAIEGAKVLEQTDGPKRELTDDQGGKRDEIEVTGEKSCDGADLCPDAVERS